MMPNRVATTQSPPAWASRLVVAVALVSGTSSCVRTTIRTGRAPGETIPAWQDRWHHAFLLGFSEPNGAVEPGRICPNGWSELDAAVDPLQSALAVLTLGIYTPTTVTVVCADPEAVAPLER